MFDWNDEELANIIWGEAGESDDHIVPYRGANDDYCDKEWKQEPDTVKPTEQKTPKEKTDLHSRKLESSSKFNTGEEISTSKFGTDSWADSSLSDVAKNEQHFIAKEIQLDKDGEMFENPNEGGEQGDIDDYGWANIGSFDDLDRIFSDDDTMFGHASLGNGEELWSSSTDATNSSIKAFPVSSDSPSFTSKVLTNASEHLGIKTDNAQQDHQSITPGYEKMDYSASHGPQIAPAILDHVEYAGAKSKPVVKEQTDLDTGKSTLKNSFLIPESSSTANESADKVSRQRKILRCGKRLDEKTEEKALQDCYGTRPSPGNPSGPFENQLACFMEQSSPSALSQNRQFQGPESFPYQHISNQYAGQPVYGNLNIPNPAMHVSSYVQPGEFKQQNSFSGYEVSPGDANTLKKSADTSPKCLTMTPQEKIEKLRKRQQLQALLAIQKQQQQINHQISSTSQSDTHKCPQENRIPQFERADREVDGLSTLPSLDPTSSVEQGDSSMVSAEVNDSAEDTILYRLQEIISKLDIEVRLCIRDSLFRLAQSAVQRHYAGETSSSNKSCKDEHEVVAKEQNNCHNRYGRMLDMETETNPIDRTVAHLLFHRPMDLSGKHSDAAQSPISTKLPHESKTEGLVTLSNDLPDSLKIRQCLGSTDYCPLAKPNSANQFKISSYMDHSENASNNVPADGGTMKVKASQ